MDGHPEVERALSVRNPWAWAIAHEGKNIENRSWSAPDALIGERIAIHASRYPGHVKMADEWEAFALFCEVRRLELLHRVTLRKLEESSGAIVATAALVRVVTKSENPWFVGPVGFELNHVIALREPIPCKGALRFWRVPRLLRCQIRTQEIDAVPGWF